LKQQSLQSRWLLFEGIEFSVRSIQSRLVDVLLDPDAFADRDRLLRAAARKAKLRERDVRHVIVRRRSVDAR
jgi:hypothetical protein